MKKTGCVCRQVGFTLVELIVTITIMMVATMIGVVSFQLSSQKSRDGRRISDLEKIRIALEMYRQDSGVYPQTATVKSDLTNVSRQYMQAWPLDPKGSDLYVYSRGTSYTYTLDAQMENSGSTTPCGGCAAGYNYRVTNP